LPQASPNYGGSLGISLSAPILEETNTVFDEEVRPMPFIIFFLMISWPVLEVASIIQMGKWVGGMSTFLLLAAGFAFGAFLIRSQSRIVGLRIMEAMKSGSPPEKALLDSGTTTLAGVLFMVPGFISDAIAALLLVPAFRSFMWRGVSYGVRSRSGEVRTQPRTEAGFNQPQQKPKRADDVIDVDYTEVPREQGGGSSAHRADSPWGKPQ
jgi:UPF0716 protein FxsA